MEVSEQNGTSNVINKSAINFLAKIIMCMISNRLSQILLYTAHMVQINSAWSVLNSWGVALSTLPPYSAEIKEEVEVYLYTPSGPSWQAVGWTLPLLWFWPVSGRSGMCHQHLHSYNSKMWCTGTGNTAACLDYTGLGSTWHSSKAGTQWTAAIHYVLSGLCASLTFHLADTMQYSTGEHDACMVDKGNVQRCLWGRCNGRKISK